MSLSVPASNHSVRAVVFDLDNTLVDTLGAIVAAFNVVMAPEAGRDLTTPEVVSYFGPTEENCLRNAVKKQDVEESIERFHRAYAERIRGLTPYPGIVPILQRLRTAGKVLGLATGKGRRTTRATLEALGLAPLFSAVMTGDDVIRNKPHPEPLLRIAEAARCRPEQLVMVGDALADIRSARAAGATALLALWGHRDPRPGHDEQARAEAHAVLPHVADLEVWLASHGSLGPDTPFGGV